MSLADDHREIQREAVKKALQKKTIVFHQVSDINVELLDALIDAVEKPELFVEVDDGSTS